MKSFKHGLLKLIKNKYSGMFSITLFLAFLLYISCTCTKIEFASGVFATKKDQSSTNTKQQTDQSSKQSTGDMVELLARLINGEARGEPYKGQVSVAAVVMNRVRSAEFPDTISGVIYQKGQFTCVTDGQINLPIAEGSTAHKAAREAINGSDPTNGCLFFYNAKTAKSKWIFSRKVVTVIGKHTFAL